MADLNWAFSISDEMTKPLEHIEEALRHLPKDIDAVDKAIARLERHEELSRLSKMTNTLQAQKAMLRLHRKDIGSSKKEVGGFFARMKDTAAGVAMGNLLTGIGSAAVGMARSVADGVKSLVEFAFDAAEGKRAAIAMLEPFEGANAAKVEGLLGDMAKAAGVAGDKTVDMFKRLRGAGFQAKEAQDVVAAALDIRAMQGGGAHGLAAAEKFIDMFGKIGALSKSSPKELKMLGLDLSISPEALAEQMAKRTKVSAKAALAQLEAGKADAIDIQNAVLDVIQQRGGGGPFGALAKKFQAGDVKGQLSSLKENLEDMFDVIDFSPIARGIQFLRDKLDKGGLAAKVGDVMVKLGPIMEGVIDRGIVVFEVFSKAFDSRMAKDMVSQLQKFIAWLDLFKPGALEDFAKMFAFIAKMIGAAVFAAVAFVAATLKVAEVLRGVLVGTFEVLGELVDKMFSLGPQLIDGLVRGITGSLGRIGETMGEVAGTVLGTLKKKLGIRSPSREMMRLGEYTGEGFAIGLSSTMPTVDVGDFGSRGAAAGATASRSIVVQVGDIIISGGVDPTREAGERVQKEIRGAILSALEGFALA